MDADRHMIARFGMITLHVNIQSPFDAVFPNYNVSIPKYSFIFSTQLGIFQVLNGRSGRAE
jgi:hypothetical protein